MENVNIEQYIISIAFMVRKNLDSKKKKFLKEALDEYECIDYKNMLVFNSKNAYNDTWMSEAGFMVKNESMKECIKIAKVLLQAVDMVNKDMFKVDEISVVMGILPEIEEPTDQIDIIMQLCNLENKEGTYTGLLDITYLEHINDTSTSVTLNYKIGNNIRLKVKSFDETDNFEDFFINVQEFADNELSNWIYNALENVGEENDDE